MWGGLLYRHSGRMKQVWEKLDGAGFVFLSLRASEKDLGVSPAQEHQLSRRKKQNEGPGARGWAGDAE